MNALGLRIVTSAYLPMVQDGTIEARVKGHPLVYWLSRQLARLGVRLEPDVVWRVPRFTYQVVQHGNVLYCHPSMLPENQALIDRA